MDHLLKTKKENKDFFKNRESRYIDQKQLGKASFQHNITYGVFKEFPRRTAFDKAFNIAKKFEI